MNGTEAGRAGLLEFERLQPENFWRADAHLQRVVEHWGGDATKAWLDNLDRFRERGPAANVAPLVIAIVITGGIAQHMIERIWPDRPEPDAC